MGDRRVPFFLGSAVVCGLLVFVADAQFRWVAEATGVTYVVLALLVALDSTGRGHSRRRPEQADTERTFEGRAGGQGGSC